MDNFHLLDHPKPLLAAVEDADVSMLEQASQMKAIAPETTVWALPGHLSGLNVFHSKLIPYGAFVWARRALNRPEWWFPQVWVYRNLVQAYSNFVQFREKLEDPRVRTTPSWPRNWSNFSLL